MVKKSWFLVFLIVTAACLDEPDCYSLNNDIIGISFKKLADRTADTLAITAIATLEPPLIFYAGDTTLSSIALPLNYVEDETAYVFQGPETTHFLRLGYISQAQFVSENCGERFVLSRLRVLEHSFDSVRVINDTPGVEGGTTHIEIFQ